MVGSHVGNGFRTEIALAVKCSTVEYHLRETGIVSDCRNHALTTRLPLFLHAGIEHLRTTNLSIIGHCLGHQRLLGGIGYVKASVLHAERSEQPLLFKLIEGLAGDNFDYATKNFGAVAVVPGRAGLIHERKLRYTFRKLCVIEVTIEQVGSDVRLLDQAITKVTVSDSGSVTHQVLNGDRALGGHRFERDPIFALRLDAYPDIRK